MSLPSFDFLAYPMVCFCDIPLSRIFEHTVFYGEYGFGLTKEWGLANKLAPLIYAPNNSPATNLANHLMLFSHTGLSDAEEQRKITNSHLYRLLSYTKPLSGHMLIAGSIVEKDFYQESEWRFVPETQEMIAHEYFAEEKDADNKKMEEHALLFSPSDVRYIFVKQDHEIPDLVDFINTKMGHHPHNALKLLVTRILSLESLARDV